MSTTYTGPRCPGPSTADLIRADGDDAPARLTEESFVDLGDADIPFSRYFDAAFFDAEMQHMWAKTWQWACRLEQIPEPGDYVVYDIGRWSVLVVRGTPLPERRTARSLATESLKQTLSQAWGVPLDHYTVSEMMDSIEYFLFPNACFFPGVTLPMVYRFRPIGDDPSKTLFDLLFLQPLPDGQVAPRAPDPVRIGVDDSFMSVPGMNQTLGHVYDQDTANLKLQWQGMRAAAKQGQTLGRYQEVRVRHLHRTTDEYIARGSGSI